VTESALSETILTSARIEPSLRKTFSALTERGMAAIKNKHNRILSRSLLAAGRIKFIFAFMGGILLKPILLFY